MFSRALAAALVAAALTSTVLAADGAKCGAGTLCPKDSPCCGQYGDCGVGAFCLGGCDPVNSHSLNACVPNPYCKSGKYKLNSLNDVQSNDKYLGDNSKVNWQSQGMPVIYQDSLLLTMAEGTVGTLLASTFYVWYGKICAKMTTSQGAGVVTAFIMMSDVKDEIDFEFVGVDIANAQSNFYSQGVTNYNNGRNLTVGNTVEKVHEYCIDWQEDKLTWSIDGKEARSLDRKDTWNATSNRWDYPQTPSRVMLSLWPAGLPTNEKGTIDWSGGQIRWDSPYMQNGYYYAMVSEVNVDCYDPPAGVSGSGKTSYIYTDKAATNNTVQLSGKQVILGSIYASGEDPSEGATSVSNAPKPTKSLNTVPGGLTGGGNRAEDVSSSVRSGPAPTGAGSQPQGPGAPPGGSGNGNGGDSQTFSQGNTGTGQGAGTNLQPGLSKVGGAAFAIVVAVLGLIVI